MATKASRWMAGRCPVRVRWAVSSRTIHNIFSSSVGATALDSELAYLESIGNSGRNSSSASGVFDDFFGMMEIEHRIIVQQASSDLKASWTNSLVLIFNLDIMYAYANHWCRFWRVMDQGRPRSRGGVHLHRSIANERFASSRADCG